MAPKNGVLQNYGFTKSSTPYQGSAGSTNSKKDSNNTVSVLVSPITSVTAETAVKILEPVSVTRVPPQVNKGDAPPPYSQAVGDKEEIFEDVSIIQNGRWVYPESKCEARGGQNPPYPAEPGTVGAQVVAALGRMTDFVDRQLHTNERQAETNERLLELHQQQLRQQQQPREREAPVARPPNIGLGDLPSFDGSNSLLFLKFMKEFESWSILQIGKIEMVSTGLEPVWVVLP